MLAEPLRAWVTDHAHDMEFVLAERTWQQLVYSDRFPAEVVILSNPTEGPVSLEARVRTCRAAGASVIVISTDGAQDDAARVFATAAAAHLTWPLEPARVVATVREILGVTPPEWRPLPTGAAAPERPRLSQSETQALILYSTGHSTPQVAERMHVQYETAKTYLRRVREKYARVGRPASKKVELIRRAIEDGLLD